MIIQSPFKDYYDYVAHVYGGGDPKIFYLRKQLGEYDPKLMYHKDIAIEIKLDFPAFYRLLAKFEPYEFKWLAIIGKLYLLTRRHVPFIYSRSREEGYVCPVEKWTLYREGVYEDLDNDLIYKPKFGRPKTYETYVGRYFEELVRVSREIKAPVFTLSSPTTVDSAIPILGELGIPAVYPAEQIYQDLSYFMGNIINEVPDLQPAGKPPMTDKEKISSHGFDLKASFRHRR